MQGLKKAKELIEQAKDVTIACHINPDGDCIGSMLALGLALEKAGKKVRMISPDGVPKRYRFLEGADRVQRTAKKAPELAVAVDCGNKDLLGRSFDIFRRAKNTIEIDHHEIREPFADVQMVDPDAAAVGEQIQLLLDKLHIEVDRAIAENILTSIIVETNSFRLPCVRPFTFELCARLARAGVDFYALADNVYWANTKEIALLSGICLSRCKFKSSGRIVWSIVRKKDFDKVKGRDEDVDAVADEMRAIRGVKIAVLFREQRKGRLRVSLRSKHHINVARVALLYGGGGHADVAGCYIPNKASSIKGILARLEKLV